MTEPLSHNNDTRKVKCQDCPWEGMIKECTHERRAMSMPPFHDIESYDLCPRCGSEDLWPLEEEGVKV